MCKSKRDKEILQRILVISFLCCFIFGKSRTNVYLLPNEFSSAVDASSSFWSDVLSSLSRIFPIFSIDHFSSVSTCASRGVNESVRTQRRMILWSQSVVFFSLAKFTDLNGICWFVGVVWILEILNFHALNEKWGKVSGSEEGSLRKIIFRNEFLLKITNTRRTRQKHLWWAKKCVEIQTILVI